MTGNTDEKQNHGIKLFAGIGSRTLPEQASARIEKIANFLAQKGVKLSSGGSMGADAIWAKPFRPEGRRIFLPWNGFNHWVLGPHVHVLTEEQYTLCKNVCKLVVPGLLKKPAASQKLLVRNVAIILGANTDEPVDFVMSWTPNGTDSGGTGMAMAVARGYGIPVYNLGNMDKEMYDSLNTIGELLSERSEAANAPA